ncbi:MAG TPA: isopentenyl-diphosphate Delta-isomerase [Chitinophagaceae bacterium]|nr:isopentenyl-diphosphate Delta-isomerase [Chitinophagaceae bacterium]HNF71165.1 isopentenyl-diphosphate Delta-isomerase [Chitinophagaceae bacterium]
MKISDQVILVDENDLEIGLCEKMKAHREGILHRAISVFIFNTGGDLLLQQRSVEKYHSAGLWSNTCCTHPFPGEGTMKAAERRLKEEMGIVTPLNPLLQFVYHQPVGNGLTEHEYDHVFTGICNENPHPDPSEVQDWLYISPTEIQKRLKSEPQQFSAWFQLCFHQVMDEMKKQFPDSGHSRTV